MTVEFEVVLPRRAVPQPLPFLHPGGDCGACCLAGLLGTTVEEAYNVACHKPEDHVSVGSGPGMRTALDLLESVGLLDRAVLDIPYWNEPDVFSWFGRPGWGSFDAWFRYLRMALDAGYYGIAPVVHNHTGPVADIDHVVLLVGARFRWVANPNDPSEGGRMGEEMVLVSDSSRTPPSVPELWIHPREFLMRWGGYSLYLARPGKSPYEVTLTV